MNRWMIMLVLLIPAVCLAAEPDPRLDQLDQAAQVIADLRGQIEADNQKQAEPAPIPAPPDQWPASIEKGRVLILGTEPNAAKVSWVLKVAPGGTLPARWGQLESVTVINTPVLVVETLETAGFFVSVKYVVLDSEGEGEREVHEGAYVAVGDKGDEDEDDDDQGDDDSTETGLLRVMAVWETDSQESPMSAAQRDIATSMLIRSYLTSHCAKTAGQPDFRFLDEDDDVSLMTYDWQELFNRAVEHRAYKPPWVVIQNDQGRLFEGPWPANPAKMLELLKKYGGE